MPRKRHNNPFVMLQMRVAKLERIRPGKDAETTRKAILKLDAAMANSGEAARRWVIELLRGQLITPLPEIDGADRDHLMDVLHSDRIKFSDKDLRKLCFNGPAARFLLRCSKARLSRAILILTLGTDMVTRDGERRFREAAADFIMHLLVNEA